MISKISIKGFKSLRDVSLELGKLNIFIGANASGKSNFFDALRVLQGIGYGFTVDEIFNGKPKGAASEVWEGIRGGSAMAGFRPSTGAYLIQMESALTVKAFEDPLLYDIEVVPAGHILTERLCWRGQKVFDTVEDRLPGSLFPNDMTKSVLHQIANRPGFHDEVALVETIDGLRNMQRLDPVPTVLRQYSQYGVVRRMGEHGENFAGVIQSFIADAKALSAYMSWLKQLTPVEGEVEVLHGALQEPLFALENKGEVFPAPVLSDGTLRFAAIAAAFFQPDMPDILLIEEIEDGIHPTRLRLLMELLKSQSQGEGPQTFVTTHSPFVLAWLKPEDYKTTFLFQRDEASGTTTVTPLSEIPRFMDVVETHSVADLFAEGWLEAAL